MGFFSFQRPAADVRCFSYDLCNLIIQILLCEFADFDERRDSGTAHSVHSLRCFVAKAADLLVVSALATTRHTDGGLPSRHCVSAHAASFVLCRLVIGHHQRRLASLRATDSLRAMRGSECLHVIMRFVYHQPKFYEDWQH